MPRDNLPASFPMEFAPRLIEEAVLLCMRQHPRRQEFHRLRDTVYECDEEETREKQFERLHRNWFVKLDLARPVGTALAEKHTLIRETRGCRVLLALRAKDEGADLHGPIPKTIVVKLRATALLDPDCVLPFLRHECMHLADMLDPCFGYEPELPLSGKEAIYDNLHRERYRMVWDTWIDGRLARQGLAPQGVRETRREEFQRTFPMLGEETEKLFSFWFDSPLQTHARLAAFALSPCSIHGEAARPSQGRCPLCGFPSFDLRDGGDLGTEVVGEIASDFPDWKRHDGLCRQCADLYESRRMSRTAEAVLPHT